MTAKLVTVRVQDYRCPAAGQVERFEGELHVVMSEIFYSLVKVVHFQDKMRTVARWLQEWFISDSKRVRANLILDPESLDEIHRSRASESENVLIESTGTRQIRGWIYDEGKFDDSHWRWSNPVIA